MNYNDPFKQQVVSLDKFLSIPSISPVWVWTVMTLCWKGINLSGERNVVLELLSFVKISLLNWILFRILCDIYE